LPERTPKNCGLQRSSVILKAEAALFESVNQFAVILMEKINGGVIFVLRLSVQPVLI
jgi:hypothetical protein